MANARAHDPHRRRPLALTLPLLLAASATLAVEHTVLTGDASPGAAPRRATLVPALKDAHAFSGALQVSLEEAGEHAKGCAAAVYFPYRAEQGAAGKTVPLRATISAAPAAGAEAAAAAAKRGETRIAVPKGDGRLLVRIEESDQKDLDAFVGKLQGETRKNVARGLAAEGDEGVPMLRFDVADPAQSGRCVALVVETFVPTAGE